MNSVSLYDALASDYDRFVDWEGRLAHELPFLVDLFGTRRSHRILDAACGTGHHAIALAQRGHEVMGTDLSAIMLERARQNAAAADVDVPFSVAGFGGLATLGETFDALLCLGNSLPHVLTPRGLREALDDFAAVLRPGGVLVIQNRNFDRVWAEQERFMPPQFRHEDDGEWLFVRFYDFHQATITFNMVWLRRDGDVWTQSVESTELRPILADELSRSLAEAGFVSIEFYGGYDGAPFKPTRSDDLITVAAH